MIATTRIAAFLGSLFLLAACGSKGPLILPPKPAATPSAPVQPAAPTDNSSTTPGAAR